MQDFLFLYVSTINAKHGDDTEEAGVHQLFGDLVVAQLVPQGSADELAAGARLLANHHLDDVLVLVHVQVFDLSIDLVRDLFGPFAGLVPGVGFVCK